MFLVDDTGSRKLKLVDFNEGRVKPFCIYQEDDCTTNSSALPIPAIKAPMLKVGDETIYVALATSVYKLKGESSESGFPVECPDSGNATIYIIPGRRKLTFSLDNGLTIDLSEGHYTLPKDDGPLLCKEHFNVMKSPIVRRLSFKSVYEVRCNLLEYDSDTRIVLRNTLLHRRSQLLTACGEDCTMSNNMMPFSECTDGQLTVYWPTDVMFPIDVHQPPTELVNRLEQRIEAIDSMINMEIFILYHSPPVIAAAKGPNNKAVQVTLYSACANNRKSYDVERDVCV
ncbi:hypothetical protein EB796_018209 [Bugula neritina]|uniref:Uncharacterized protein n=1 Tax=Bugula neritina TaxID=10212 RepID=A0A7J7JBU9_BUGNE|nr:hypothetical protein EB796_018209 [Bugula neritina]